MDVLQKLKWRYATKKFDKKRKLSEAKLHILKEAFNLTATSFGLQTITMLVVTNAVLRASLVEHSYQQKQVVDASHLLVICIQDNIIEKNVDDYYNTIKDIRNTSERILKPYRESLISLMGKMTVEERQNWSKNQAYIALGNLMTVCAAEGIDSCPMEGFVPEAYDEALGLAGMNLKSVLLLPVGYRAEDDIFSGFEKVRRSIKESVIEL